jgi:hypothetical protein
MRPHFLIMLLIGLVAFTGRLQAQDTAAISGHVYNDLNRNGNRDPGERGFFGLTVVIDADSAYTDPDGFYEFVVAAPGTYNVIELQDPETESTTPDTVTVEAEPDSVYTVDFGDYVPPAVVQGYVFEDMNRDGQRQPEELIIPDVAVTADGDTATTDADGYYSLSVEALRTVSVEEIDPPLHSSTTPNEVPLLVEPGETYRVDFGDRAVDTAVVYGVVFADSNVNAWRDPGEASIPGVPITVKSASTVTAGDGHYSFTVPAPGTYGIKATTPAGYVSTTGDSIVVACQPNWHLEINFGVMEPTPATIVMGTVFEDLNRSGVRDSNEVGIAGSIVELVLSTGNISITTGSSGAYVFALAPGTHTLAETNAPEYLSTTPDTLTLSVASGEVRQVDFGDRMIVEVPVDIKPGACPNRVNSKSRNSLPVAIAGTGTGEFVAAEIDPATLSLEGVSPLAYSLDDIASPHEPFLDKGGCNDCTKDRADGIEDFEMRFDIDEVRSAVGAIAEDTCAVLHLSGNFTDGFPFVGEDVLLIRVVGKPGPMKAQAPAPFSLSALPNPVSGSTTIRFGLPEPSTVRVVIHDILGRDVAVIAEGSFGAGVHSQTWDGRNVAGQEVGEGIYFVSIEAGDLNSTSKIIVLK